MGFRTHNMKKRNEHGVFVKTLSERVCVGCSKSFLPHSSFQRHCSQECYWKTKRGKHLSESHRAKIGAAQKGKVIPLEQREKIGAALRVYTDKRCRTCSGKFYPKSLTQTYCSVECMRVGRSKVKTLACARCKKDFGGISHTGFTKKYCSAECERQDVSEKREGAGNPAFVHGLRAHDKPKGRDYMNSRHLRACSKYRKEFIEKHGYPFCEVCRVNQNGTPKFEVHHIYFASLYPRHPQLHNFLNLILVCIQCHNNFHAGKRFDKEFRVIEKARGLKELFV